MTDIQNTAKFSQILINTLIFLKLSPKILSKFNQNYSDIFRNIINHSQKHPNLSEFQLKERLKSQDSIL